MGRGNLGVVRPIESIGSLCCGVRSKRDHSGLNNGTTCDAAFCQNSLTTCYPHMLIGQVWIYWLRFACFCCLYGYGFLRR